ncbi:hypothetical protein AVEN_274472-1 [Araneus ventricosus]|uniref:Uncharacterized protein n=1 Tax=Araneus ventricosus TaxID=182803 RepID=A0A4Y2HCM9_ARAVE|nr:hypothetical protein AVEN_274472-1 [Araneus ventricosus]
MCHLLGIFPPVHPQQSSHWRNHLSERSSVYPRQGSQSRQDLASKDMQRKNPQRCGFPASPSTSIGLHLFCCLRSPGCFCVFFSSIYSAFLSNGLMGCSPLAILIQGHLKFTTLYLS